MSAISPDGPKSMVVVGGSRGIGAALACSYAEQGVDVLALSRQPQHLHHAVELVAGDATSDQWYREVEEWLLGHDSPRLVVFSAAMLGPVGPVSHVSMDDFAEVYATNVIAPLRLIGRLQSRLSPRDRIVVLLGGGIGGPNPQPRVVAYTSSKIALAQAVESIGRDPDTRVPVVGIAPGFFPTSFTDPVRKAPRNVAGEALLAQVGSENDDKLDVTNLMAALNVVCSDAGVQLSGRTMSAGRDPWDLLADGRRLDTDLYRLRRVDGSSVRTSSDW